MIKKHIPQLVIGLFVTIVGGIAVYYVTTDNEAKANTTNINISKYRHDNNSFSNLDLSIKGSSNRINIRRGKTKLNINNIAVSGSSKELSYSIPPNYIVNVNLAGSSNSIYISAELRDFIFVNDLGSSNYVSYSDD